LCSQVRGGWLFKKLLGASAKDFQVADGRVFAFGSTTITFSPPVFHGEENTPLGWVLMTQVDCEGERVLHASDVQGPMHDATLRLMLAAHPQLVYVGGPPLYLADFRVDRPVIERGLTNLATLTAAIPTMLVDHHLLRATSGRGIVNLHHTITLYAIERVRQFFSKEEYEHLTGAWIEFMGDKRAEQIALDSSAVEGPANYTRFYETFSRLKAKSVLASVGAMIVSEQGRRQLGRFLIKALCDQYQGNYNPHYLTGLGSALWVMDQYWNHAPIAINALFQYIDFFFDGIKSKG